METTIDACPCGGELLQHDGCRQRAKERLSAIRQVQEHSLKRDDVVRDIRKALRHRGQPASLYGNLWSVKGGRGTSYGWITITVAPRFEAEFGSMAPEHRELLAKVLGLESVHHQGVMIPAGHEYYREYLLRALTGEPGPFKGEPYWD